ncbi:hypothetical protein E8E13_004489 [Curvularia kusanoi]|uniref:Heterokaryon incompatibility domain-containing protein n=1 Tax=Curvularia kusanoi TaxID=90978 RepID=A0A9P4W2U5_CURKU|nr:hypothetical protein E8E13_004489 [Curvularia kusanoi]
MSDEEMEMMGEESEMSEDESEMGDDEMETSDQEIEPSDDEAEMSDDAELAPTGSADACHYSGYLMDALPKTFRDAAYFCWKLGIRYIWIDALCILQDSEKDWNEATVYMAGTYEGAVVTIAASWSSSSNDGCFAQATTKLVGTALAESGLYIAAPLLHFPDEIGQEDPFRWPLLSRAWVFQERKLSPRVLHFGRDQLFWECDSRFTSEGAIKSLSDPYGDLSESSSRSRFRYINPGDPKREWRNAVEYYSRLKLTYEKDRLPAIAGYVRRMQERRPGDVYIAGMWLNSLLSDLDWLFNALSRNLQLKTSKAFNFAFNHAVKGMQSRNGHIVGLDDKSKGISVFNVTNTIALTKLAFTEL